MDSALKNPDAVRFVTTISPTASLPELVDVDLFLGELFDGSNTFSELPTEHFYAENQYVRTMSAPRGCVVVGKKHKQKTLNILLEGEMLVYTGESARPVHMKAGDIFESGPSVRKILVAIEDSKFANIHVTNLTDVAQIEAKFIYPESQEMLEDDVKTIFAAARLPCLG